MTTPERVPNSTPVESQINQLQPRPEKSPYQPQSVKGWWNRFFAALLLSSQLSACISAESRFVVPTDTEPRVVATSVLPPQKSPESAAPTVPQPSPTATKEALAPTSTYTVEASGGTYTTAQEKLNKSPEALSQQQRLQRWLDYWVQFDNRPFALDSADIHWKYIYDNAKNPTEVMTLLEVSGPDYQNKLFTVPMNEEGFVDYPPTVTGKYIQPGLGPLEINPHKDNTILSVDQGTLVRLDSQGKIVERLSQAHWEAVERYPIDIEKLHNFPESYEYMVNNLNEFVEFPDPFVDPDGFNASVEKLKTIIGDYTQREKNYIGSIADQSDFYVADAFLSPNQLEGQPEIAYFQHQGIVYPMIGLNVYGTDSASGSTRTLLVILYNGPGALEGTSVINALANGGHIRSVRLIKTEWSDYPDFVNKAIQAGIVPVDDGTYDQIIFGVGDITTEEGFQKIINGN